MDLHDDFIAEYAQLSLDVQDELLAHIALLERFGPQLGRPAVDTLNGSSYTNMKELRFVVKDGVWRFAFAFDQTRRAMVLCGGDKAGISMKRFYKGLIAKADQRFSGHLAAFKKPKSKNARRK